jgi:class 3 adenylate cyclase
VCPRCGSDNPTDTPVCSRCGSRLADQQAAPARSGAEGERRFAVILFADIAGFTRISDGLDPEEVTWLVNRCLDEMSRAVVSHGGRVDKYTGDGLMGVFGAPTSRDDDPVRALRAALAVRERVSLLRLGPHIPSLALHVGAACGSVVAAEIGGRERKQYTVIGRAVNVASRLEDASAPGQILVAESLQRLTAQAFEFRPIVLMDARGLAEGTRVFELIRELGASSPT